MKKNTKNTVHDLLQAYRDQHGISIREHSFAAPILMVLLRHVGCSFCRKALHELSASMKHINACGYRVGLVHMDSDADMRDQLSLYGLEKLPRFHDAERKLYQALGVPRAPLMSVFRRDAWARGVEAKRKYGAGLPKSDPLQLPGAFLIDQGIVIAGEPTMSPYETPDFLALLIRSEAAA
ncbi:MAG TPA: redoxin domain-containing protein [Kiritimatiellia bacterium]|nr:redoxin domain-containing protein [Kiritimatiellia bacterium]HMP00169.1 redoxin domain-containing protein [Kiritimatiellia bacterium]HMP96806.1 redoxin domain-containing protein [Kiritimatiellia bacterium]